MREQTVSKSSAVGRKLQKPEQETSNAQKSLTWPILLRHIEHVLSKILLPFNTSRVHKSQPHHDSLQTKNHWMRSNALMGIDLAPELLNYKGKQMKKWIFVLHDNTLNGSRRAEILRMATLCRRRKKAYVYILYCLKFKKLKVKNHTRTV